MMTSVGHPVGWPMDSAVGGHSHAMTQICHFCSVAIQPGIATKFERNKNQTKKTLSPSENK